MPVGYPRSLDERTAVLPFFRGSIYRSTAEGASMSSAHLTAVTSSTPSLEAALPVREDDTDSAGSLSKAGPCKTFLRHNILTLATLAAVAAGITLGVVLRSASPWSRRHMMYMNFPGEIFLRMLRGLILPLITSSMVAAVGSLDARLSGKIGLRAVVYYFSTTFMAIILGIVLVVGIQPGSGDTKQSSKESNARLVTTADTLMDLIRNAFPPNVIEACVSQFSTIVIKPENSTNTSMYEWDFKTVQDSGTNILGLIVFSIALGAALGKMGQTGRPLLDFFTALSDAMMMITKVVVWFSPVGVMFLVLAKMLEMDDFSVVAGQVGMYTITVLTGLLLHGFVVLPVIYTVIMRRHPFGFLLDMLQAITTAFGTASSSATLPVTISALEDKVKLDPRVVRFCIPIGATINMDGTALYEAVAAIFIAQVRDVPMDIGKVIAISVTATAASIGAAGIPQAGLVTMVMVLNAVGLPADDITLIIVVDWFLDRFRTAINVLGDAIGACVVEKLSSNDLKSSMEASSPENKHDMHQRAGTPKTKL
ncbi:excitatory amino acid transporter 3-like isoform X2 [Ornithodoros turicata]|uniref:excitatory amino acid transporter 3-like isoform X2 n=1 Tax=Ornithodoros turicata TaxID=34597 RepID=UPI003138C242